MYTIKCTTGHDLLNGRSGCYVEDRKEAVVKRGSLGECEAFVRLMTRGSKK